MEKEPYIDRLKVFLESSLKKETPEEYKARKESQAQRKVKKETRGVRVQIANLQRRKTSRLLGGSPEYHRSPPRGAEQQGYRRQRRPPST